MTDAVVSNDWRGAPAAGPSAAKAGKWALGAAGCAAIGAACARPVGLAV